MAGLPNIKISAGSGGKVKNMTVAGAVAGGVGNEYSGAPPKGALQTDISKLNMEIEGPSGNADFENVKLLGVVEGGIQNKQVDSTTDKKASKDPEEHYKMTSEPRGLCYIFNNKKFDGGKGQRTGTDKDRDDMVRVFKKLKFEVKAFDDSEADVMETRLKKLAKMDHTAHDCVVVVFLTHGRDGAVKGTDNDWLAVSTITDYFKSHSCPSLANKPKLFFFQSCRGLENQKGMKVKSDGCDDDSDNEGAIDATEVEELVAPEADFFFGYSTVPGMKAQRNVESGSWYIQELAKTLEESASRIYDPTGENGPYGNQDQFEDLLGMMTTVKRRLNSRKAECTDGSYLKQTAEMTSRLLKKLYF